VVVEYKLFRIGVDGLMNADKTRQYRNAFAIFVSLQIMKSGHRIYERNQRHRARIEQGSCAYLLFQGLKSSNLDSDTRSGASFGGALLCNDKYGYKG
jgi:hypothetical protein